MIEKNNYPILEFDSDRKAIIEPSDFFILDDLPEYCVLCSLWTAIKKLKKYLLTGKIIKKRKLKIAGLPLFELKHNGKRIILSYLPIGAPLAAGIMEELIAAGCRKFIACGTAGVLRSDIPLGNIIIPDSAIRDEGTSYHYIHPDKEVRPHDKAVSALREVCDEKGIDFMSGKTWTTDAFLRETRNKIQKRIDHNCLTVDMEAASLFAVAEFRGVIFGQLLYGLDDVSSQSWNSRAKDKPKLSQEDAFWLAVEACARL